MSADQLCLQMPDAGAPGASGVDEGWRCRECGADWRESGCLCRLSKPYAPPELRAAERAERAAERDLSECEVGTRVRYRGAMRDVVACPECGLPAAAIEHAKRGRRSPARTEYAHGANVSCWRAS